jgi:hypothetical protein
MEDSEQRPIALSRELVDMIIDQLVGDRESLRHCSLVSKQWRPRSRYQLFRVVVFSDSLPGQSIERWCAAFGISDGMCLLIRHRAKETMSWIL